MKIFRLLSILLLATFSLSAQQYDPVKWTMTVHHQKNGEAELHMTAKIEKGWHVYSIDIPVTSPVIATAIAFEESENYELIGGITEPEPHEEYDPNFEEVLKWHKSHVTFKQKIKVLSSEDFEVKAERTFMVCNESMCLPPAYTDISWNVKGQTAKNSEESTEEASSSTTPEENVKQPEQKEHAEEAVENNVKPEKEVIDYAYDGEDTTSYEGEEKEEEHGASEVVSGDSQKKSEKRSMLAIFILSFLGGFAALLTPCVFPMIPLTVSFFTKQSKTRAKGISNAIIYGLAIIGLYTGLGLFITKVFGSDALNAFSTNPYVNIGFFVLLVIFAISFFGAFEITLPSSWINKSDQASDKGGVLGIFFMASTLALVSFSCTGPIIGTLLFEAASGGYQGPLVGMFGFSLALALPFALFAAFPGWLNSMPKSGGWLNSVKVVLGFIELAFAFKFLSTADLVWQAGILQREWFIAIWIAIFGLLTLYLLGKFRMPHDSPMDKLSVSRLMFSIITFSFVIYLIPGLWGAPLKLISGFPPPMFYSESPQGFGGSKATIVASGGSGHGEGVPEGSHPETCPHQLNCFHDFETGLAYAKKVNKPIMLDFTGWGCVNCRKMEDQVWIDEKVLSILRKDVVLISLYVDDREVLPKEEQYVSEVTGNKVKTIGNKWSEFQLKHYQTNAQPQYIILGHESMQPLNGSTAYDPDVDLYVNWLKEGIGRFKK